MIAALARPGASALHRTAAGRKLAGLAIVATVLFFVDEPRLLAVAFGLGLAAARSTGTGFADIGRDLAAPALVLAVLGLVDWAMVDGRTAARVEEADDARHHGDQPHDADGRDEEAGGAAGRLDHVGVDEEDAPQELPESGEGCRGGG